MLGMNSVIKANEQKCTNLESKAMTGRWPSQLEIFLTIIGKFVYPNYYIFIILFWWVFFHVYMQQSNQSDLIMLKSSI